MSECLTYEGFYCEVKDGLWFVRCTTQLNTNVPECLRVQFANRDRLINAIDIYWKKETRANEDAPH
jgi:hypothetical protein